MRAHEAPRPRRTGRTSRAALALVTAASAALLTGACAGPADDSPVAAPVADPQAAQPDTTDAAADAAVEFFAAFDEIVLTGDESHWTDRSSPDCFYCTAIAGFGVTFGLTAGLQDARADDAGLTLGDLDLEGFDVEVREVSRSDGEAVAVDVEIEQHLSDQIPLSPPMIGPDGTLDVTRWEAGAAAGKQPARVTLTHDGERWTVEDITAVPGSDGAAESADGAGEGPTPSPEMAQGDVEGAVAALEHYLALEQHVYRTGEAGELEAMSAPDCAPCRTKRDLALDAVAAGLEIEAGRSRVELVRRVRAEEILAPEDLDPEMDQDVYVLETRVHTTDTTVRTPEGEKVHPAGEYALHATLLAGPDGDWYVADLTEGA